MAHGSADCDSRNTSTSANNDDRELSSQSSLHSDSTSVGHLISQLSDSRTPTTRFLLFENALSNDSSLVRFLEYHGTRARNHHTKKLYVPQIIHTSQTSSDEAYGDFADCIKQVLSLIPHNDLSSYVVSIRTGVLYYFSKRFRFKNNYSIEQLHNVTQKKISLSDIRYYHPQTNNYNQSDESLRSSFCNVKPISRPQEFADELAKHQFHIKQQKHVFRLYLQSDDKQTHVCTVDPATNYSIVEFSKDFQRTSNIDIVRDRSSSKFQRAQTYDDIFDFRIQFQYNPCTRRDQMNTIDYELHQEFPLLDRDFKNENILQPSSDNVNKDHEFHISAHLLPYLRFIRRDFGDVYHYKGEDKLFENFTIYLESSDEYRIDHQQLKCKRELDTHGLVYARLDLSTMMSSNAIDEDLLISKLWDMGNGLTSTAGRCTTSETQQSTNYYNFNGETYTAEDEALVQTILKQSSLRLMLGLQNYAPRDVIQQNYNRIRAQLDTKWHRIRSGPFACDKLKAAYDQYFNENH